MHEKGDLPQYIYNYYGWCALFNWLQNQQIKCRSPRSQHMRQTQLDTMIPAIKIFISSYDSCACVLT